MCGHQNQLYTVFLAEATVRVEIQAVSLREDAARRTPGLLGNVTCPELVP